MSAPSPLSALAQAVRSLGEIRDTDELLDGILTSAQPLVGFDHCALVLADPERGDLWVRRALGYGERRNQILAHRLAYGQGLTGWAAEHRSAIRVGDVRGDPRYLQGLAEVRSSLAVPLVAQGELVGILVAEANRVDAFGPEHEQILGVFGAHAALVVLAASTQDRLRQRLAQINALYRISRIASEKDDLTQVLRAMLEVAQEVIPEGNASILLLDPATRCLKVGAQHGYPDAVEQLAIPLGKGVTGRSAQTGQVFVVDDVTKEADYIPGVAGARSEIAVPLVADGKVIGVLNAESRQVAAYGPDHARTLGVIAQQAAVVLRAAQLHGETLRLAVTDPLTGLHNRRHFVARLEQTLRRARRYRESFALVLLAVDLFKSINDRHGHGWGDRVLQAVGGAMGEWVRDTDDVARIGGDEFAALLLQSDPESAVQVVERLRDGIRALELREGDEGIPITISAGIALYPHDGGDAEGLLSRAEGALHDAKRLGRDRSVLSQAPAGERAVPDPRA